MSRSIDPVAYTQAMRQWVVPECLHVPIAAKDEQALIDHVGDIVRTLSPGRAYLIAVEDPPPRDLRLPIWKMENTEIFHDKLQIWVNPLYTRYRAAYKKGKPDERIDDKVLHHCGNRRIAYLQGYKFIRLISISRRANSSSRFSEQWGVDLNTPDYVERLNAKGISHQIR